jgi:hypothetical protein
MRQPRASIATDVEASDHLFDAFDQDGLEGRTPRAARMVLFYRKNGLVNSLMGNL